MTNTKTLIKLCDKQAVGKAVRRLCAGKINETILKQVPYEYARYAYSILKVDKQKVLKKLAKQVYGTYSKFHFPNPNQIS